ncbi:MAG: hypothetical protein V1899_04285 [Planctomycetota bacterium]
MTVDEARALLAPYAEGMLNSTQALELEALLSRQPELQAEFKNIKEENELLSQALSPLLSSQSTRMRVSENMANVYAETAREADKALIKKTQRINRWLMLIIIFGFLTIIVLAMLWNWVSRNKPTKPRQPLSMSQYIRSSAPTQHVSL